MLLHPDVSLLKRTLFAAPALELAARRPSVVVLGATGRVGRRLVQCARERAALAALSATRAPDVLIGCGPELDVDELSRAQLLTRPRLATLIWPDGAAAADWSPQSACRTAEQFEGFRCPVWLMRTPSYPSMPYRIARDALETSLRIME